MKLINIYLCLLYITLTLCHVINKRNGGSHINSCVGGCFNNRHCNPFNQITTSNNDIFTTDECFYKKGKRFRSSIKYYGCLGNDGRCYCYKLNDSSLRYKQGLGYCFKG